MKKKVLFCIAALLLVGCNNHTEESSLLSVISEEQTISIIPNSNETISEDNTTTVSPDQTSVEETSNTPSIEVVSTMPSIASTVPSTISVAPSVTSASSYTSQSVQNDIPSNEPFSLNEWEIFPFSDGSESFINEYWTYYYGTSVNPNNGVRGDKYGVDLDYNTKGLISPLFDAWEKVEVNIDLYFIARTSSKYKPVANEPQFKLMQYDQNGNYLDVQEVYIDSSKVNANKTKYTLKLDVYNNQMNYLDLKYNNSVEKSSKYYTFAISQISLKGWPYGKK